MFLTNAVGSSTWCLFSRMLNAPCAVHFSCHISSDTHLHSLYLCQMWSYMVMTWFSLQIQPVQDSPLDLFPLSIDRNQIWIWWRKTKHIKLSTSAQSALRYMMMIWSIIPHPGYVIQLNGNFGITWKITSHLWNFNPEMYIYISLTQ